MIYSVAVKFNKDFVEVDEEEKRILFGVRSKPIKGKANSELIKKISQHFGIPTSNIRIVSGMNSKDKLIEIIK